MLVTKQKVLRKFWYAVMPISHLADGPRPFTLLGEKIVLWLKADGTPAALQDRCCHRTAQLSKGFVENDNIVCGYHGWTYDCSGACVRIPQNADAANPIPPGTRVTSYFCQERYGYAWVALEQPLRDIPDFPEDALPGYRRIFQFYERWETSPLRFMENSFDNAHFSYVHRATFGVYEQPKPEKASINETDYGFESETLVPVKNVPASYRVTGVTTPFTKRHMFNRWYLPFVRRFGCKYPESGRDHIIYNCATPMDDGSVMLAQWLYRNDSEADCPEAELIAWDTPILGEDRGILEATDPDVCIDIGRRQEMHMASDKPGLIMRKMLLELLHQHGEAEVFRGSTAD
jgi:phenylpropionate dioxygenase-like ring-hydroxylating dioxygenase large terminal subunit